jgi:hypothetical protein
MKYSCSEYFGFFLTAARALASRPRRGGANRAFRENLSERFGEFLIKNRNVAGTGHVFVAFSKARDKSIITVTRATATREQIQCLIAKFSMQQNRELFRRTGNSGSVAPHEDGLKDY